MTELQKLIENTRVRALVVALTMVGLSGWIYSRIYDINPAILQDEWIYLVTSQLSSPWSQTPPYDFGNYLFNLIYSSTTLCGSAFYSCGKLLNLVFLALFATALFLVALGFMPFWRAYVLMIAVYLSPITIYASMYLPESLYFAMIGLALIPLSKRILGGPQTSWIWTGGALGLAALAKPHALFSVAAIGIFLLVFEFSKRDGIVSVAKAALQFGLSFLAIRLILGFAIAGPKALDLLGNYGAGAAVGEFVSGVGSNVGQDSESLVGAGRVEGAIGLFVPQVTNHLLVISALIGALLAVFLIATVESVRRKSQTPAASFSVLMIIWIAVMLIVVALFSGWITGGGDDHTTRVLLRYYEFLIPIATIPAVAYLYSKEQFYGANSKVRILSGVLLFFVATASFSGVFGRLQIQIADAPSVAGLISDELVWNLVGVSSAIGIVAIAFFPKNAPFVVLSALALSLVGMGYQTQAQYRVARADHSPADYAGLYAKSQIPAADIQDVTIIASSRFDGRVASFWMQSNSTLKFAADESTIDAGLLEPGTTWVLTLGGTALENYEGTELEGEGFILYRLEN